jgi:predicted dehydrogenase
MAIMFASRDLRRAERYRATYGGAAAFGSYEDALRDSRVHGVLLCTPHDLHLEHALLAARHRKHLLVEKPLARSLDEADQIRAAADAAGIVLMVGENFRFMPAFRRVESYLDAGVIGPLREIRIAARGHRLPTGWRLSRTAMGGGTLIDGGIHYLSLLNQWGKRVELVFALSPTQAIEEMEGEDSVVLIARLAGGAVATLSNSLSTPGCFRTQWASVSGNRGSVLVDNQGRFLLLRTRMLTRFHFFRKDRRGHQAMLREFLGAVREERTPRMDGREGRRDLSVVMAAYRSIAEQRPMEVET